MTMKHLLTLARTSQRRLSFSQAIRSASSAVASVFSPSTPSFIPPYDQSSNSINSKLKKLQNPDTRFLQHASPNPTLASHVNILSVPETRVTTLPNGLRVATESKLSAKTATVGVWIDAGSRFESESTNSTAHFLEHMIFKGTERRSKRGLEEEVEDIGGHLNAYTSREHTTYFAKVMDRDVNQALDVLADILQNSVFDETRIEQERGVILREMQEVEEKMEEVVFDHLHATAFQHKPLGRTILGPVENIKSITKEDIQNYIKTHYAANRIVIAAAGAVKHEDIVEQVKRLFTKLSTGSTTASELVKKEPAKFTGSEVRMINDDLPLAQFAIAFEGASWRDPDCVALMVIQAMLGSWNKSVVGGKHTGSALAQKVAVNEIAESIMAFNTNYKDTGLFGIYAVVKPDCVEDLSHAIMYELTKLAYEVSEEDVTRTQNQLKSSWLCHLDGTTPVAEDIGRQLLTYGRRIPTAELYARIDAVDSCTVKRVANKFIYDKDMAISAIGPIQDLPDYNWFRRRTYWNRY